MKKAFIILPLIFFACRHVTPYKLTNYFLNESAMSELRAKRVAVLPFGATASRYGTQMADEFNVQLGKLGIFELVERQRVEELFKEQDFDPKRLDPETAVKIGKMLGAHGVILGNVMAYSEGKVGASVKLVNVETGEQIWQASDVLNGDDKRVKKLVEKSDHYRLLEDPAFLSQVLCRLMAETLKGK
ncbi:MAG: CsgG/HfaB family protein [candidate division WOR-3 bacterium]